MGLLGLLRAREAKPKLHPPPLLPVLRALAGRRSPTADEPLTGPFDPTTLLAGVAEVRASGAPFAHSRPCTIAFDGADGTPLSRPPHRPGTGIARRRPMAVTTGVTLHAGGLPPPARDRRRTAQGRRADLGGRHPPANSPSIPNPAHTSPVTCNFTMHSAQCYPVSLCVTSRSRRTPPRRSSSGCRSSLR